MTGGLQSVAHFKCVICGNHFRGFGNNPAPIKKRGRCCDWCDGSVVIPERIRLVMEMRK